MVAGPLVEEMEGGEEDELWFLDGGQVELKHIFAMEDSWGENKLEEELNNWK